ncbi:MAG: hypothetical protein KJO12_09320 [Ignavibacteria bacterium]|nr:hypothetical protein [Ignavibacteria bacterium]
MQNYSTKDFYAAGYLLAEGFKLISHSRIGRITTFEFEGNQSAKEAADKYFTMQTLVEPVSYGNALRLLKSILHSYGKLNADGDVNNYVKQYRRIKS